MIRSGIETRFPDIPHTESGREIDPYSDPEIVRLVAINLELAVRNLMDSAESPDCLVLTADICSHKLIAIPGDNGDVNVLVIES